MHKPVSIDELQDIIRSAEKVRACGAGTKPALSRDATLTTTGLTGILEYEPSEYTFTALAGTPLSEIRDALAKNGQLFPFDPPFVEAGATIGGTTASGLSGPGRFRYGGIRDFILGVKMVTGEGRVVFGGGKVVKNAAGFDIPKLVTGSLGRMGVLVELTFKVFPIPETWTTIRADFSDIGQASAAMIRLAMSQQELQCLDLEPPGRVWLRIGGLSGAVAVRTERVRTLLQNGDSSVNVETFSDEDDVKLWSYAREFRWVSDNQSLMKMPISPTQVTLVEKLIGQSDFESTRRYSVGGNVLWLAVPRTVTGEAIDQLCQQLGRPALALTGSWSDPQRGARHGHVFAGRLLSVFDPGSRFLMSPTA
ncbi:MAG: FAD-binding protein [Planctomycetota bacterium]|nr:FAD-binding protein [Planctomycetota bacterium]